MQSKNNHQEDIPLYDIFIIGGGINGAGIANEASRLGYKVCLCESGDFGGGTSSASSKLIHGGLRYLEHYEFLLVRKALKEREILWQMAPHIIRPMRFVLPHHKGLRPKWLLRLGLFLYDSIGGRKLLPPSNTLNLKKDAAGDNLKSEFTTAFEYSDCAVDDARLVILNLIKAQNNGADIMPRTAVQHVKYDNHRWHCELRDQISNTPKKICAKLVINATGPWVDEVLTSVFKLKDQTNIRLVRGSHIIVKKKFEHDRAYLFQNADERIIFAIPYEDDYTLIGTTDADHDSMQRKPEISSQETEYLCQMASEYFDKPVSPDDIVWSYAGVRALYDDGASKAQEATRSYVIGTDFSFGDGRLINIFGGKITTYRRLAKDVCERAQSILGKVVKKTHAEFNLISDRKKKKKSIRLDHLPGGDFDYDNFDGLVIHLCKEYPFLERNIMTRLARLYGTRTREILGNSASIEALGRSFGAGLYEREVNFLLENEWALTAEDILYRRTKLGLHMSKAQMAALDKWLKK